MVRYDNGVVMPKRFVEVSEKLYNFELRDDDIWIVTFPKSGTTWTQEMVWMLVNNVDEEKGAAPLFERSPFLESGAIGPKGPRSGGAGGLGAGEPGKGEPKPRKDPLAYAHSMTGRRVLKVHLPLEFLPPGLLTRCKVIYVARNVRDTCVSFYHHHKNLPMHSFEGEFSEFAELFKSGITLFGDYWQHLQSGWRAREEPNVKFLWFEDMKTDQKRVIEELCVFLDHPLTEDQKAKLVEHLKFDNMKKNQNFKMGGPGPKGSIKEDFMRKGQVTNPHMYVSQSCLRWGTGRTSSVLSRWRTGRTGSGSRLRDLDSRRG